MNKIKNYLPKNINKIDNSTIIAGSIFHSISEFNFYVSEIFKNIDFQEKRMLDIGGGSGIFSYYAAIMGAQECVILEPAANGSQTDILEKYSALQNNLKLNDQVKIENKTFQAFNSPNNYFDIILLHNSINHLDEAACSTLHVEEDAQKKYKEIIIKIKNITNFKGTVIITDCSRYNFFSLLKVKNPFAPMIEWNKHQSPEIWKYLLSEVGFSHTKIRWLSFRQLRQIGKIFFANKITSYFLNSHFIITTYKI
jgi:SAM-dependent methyltransferase